MEDTLSNQMANKMNNKRNYKPHLDHFKIGTLEPVFNRNLKHKKPRNHLGVSHDDVPINLHKCMQNEHATPLRKKVDPETAKYFSEIANLFESNAVDADVRSNVCDNALEEAKGKEIELATDMIISRTLQCLLEGCDLEHLCSFLLGSAEVFPLMSVDKFGSHVAETALKSLTMHFQEDQSYSMVKETLHKICQVVGANAVNIMCNIYGSHVLRSLLCLSMGVPLANMEDFHDTKPSSALLERLNCAPSKLGGTIFRNHQNSFPDAFKFLVHEILKSARNEISALRAEKYSSFVFQSLVKLSVDDEHVLLHVIMSLLGFHEENFVEYKFTDAGRQKLKGEVLSLLEDTSSSHLLEVIVEVAPEALYNELLNVVFKGPLLDISSHRCGNFVVQALISSARTTEQINLIWEELCPYLRQLLDAGKPGVVASILAACQRLQTHINEFCRALSEAACPESENDNCIVPHLLYIDSYFRDKSHWKWPSGDKMHVLGCLMLQSLFKISNSAIRPYIESLACMEAYHILEMARDVGGGRVLEAFLCSDASVKQKIKVITKLQGNFGDLSMHRSGSFTVEKCFAATNISTKKTIAAELLIMQPELSKTKHGPYLLRKLDIEGFGRNPEQWKSSLESKAAVYQDFLAAFGDTRQDAFVHKSSDKKPERQNEITRHAIPSLENHSSPTFPNEKDKHFYGGKHGHKKEDSPGSLTVKFLSGKHFTRNSSMKAQPEMKSSNKRSSISELADLARKSKLSQGDVQKLFDPSTFGDKKQYGIPFSRKNKR